MTEQDERNANELLGLLQAAVNYPVAVRDSGIAKALVASADKLVKKLEGQPRNELVIARANLASVAEG